MRGAICQVPRFPGVLPQGRSGFAAAVRDRVAPFRRQGTLSASELPSFRAGRSSRRHPDPAFARRRPESLAAISPTKRSVRLAHPAATTDRSRQPIPWGVPSGRPTPSVPQPPAAPPSSSTATAPPVAAAPVARSRSSSPAPAQVRKMPENTTGSAQCAVGSAAMPRPTQSPSSAPGGLWTL